MKRLMLFTITLIFLLVGCDGESYTNIEDTDVELLSSYTTLIDKNLYYIERGDSNMDFPKSYNNFLKDNPNLEVIDVEIETNTNTHNSIKGYFVFTKSLD